MSTAHRPTWDPAQAKDVKGGSRQFSVRDMAAHTKLKFRFAYLIHLVEQRLTGIESISLIYAAKLDRLPRAK